MKKLSILIEDVQILEHYGPDSPQIREVQFAPNKVGSKDVFFALIYPGREGDRFSDGHASISKVIEQGASVVVCEQLPANLHPSVTYLKVANSFEAMALMVANYYGNPDKELKIVGVTGTNGKTSVVTLLHQLFRKLGSSAGLISTVVDKINDHEIPTVGTTPNAIELNQLWRQMADAGCEYCFMEVTSHAIFQKRVSMVNFAGAVFTSLTADHIGYHGSFEEYVGVKRSFFDDTAADSFIVYNADDPYGEEMVSRAVAKSYAVSSKSSGADFFFSVLQNSLQGLVLEVGEETFHSSLAAMFNAYNLVTAYSVAILLGKEATEVLKVMPLLSAIEGRFNIFPSPGGIIGIVDFAHNLGALQKLYDLLNPMKTGRMITVIGCGGDRVRQRAKIGKLTYEQSDILVLTSDNPRSEDPHQIVKEMLSGIEADPEKALIQVDRREAIRVAVEMARPGDIVLLASKGHESYQEIAGTKHPFNDKTVLLEQFERIASPDLLAK